MLSWFSSNDNDNDKDKESSSEKYSIVKLKKM